MTETPMRFRDYPYRRPSMETLERAFRERIARFRAASSAEEQNRILEEVAADRIDFETNRNLAEAHHNIDTTDKAWDAEQTFFDLEEPHYAELVNRWYDALLASPFRPQLEERWGSHLFTLAELTRRTFRPEIKEDLKKENRLKSEYVKLVSSARIPFEGQERTLAQLFPFEIAPDRARRQRAAQARWSFFAERRETTDRIFDDLVAVRAGIARRLGMPDFVHVGYARLQRSDYGAAEVGRFREQVARHVVPAANRLRERQRRRLGLDRLVYYDDNFEFPGGNATPKGPSPWILQQARRMYAQLSPETDEFFTFLLDRELMDLESKKGKAPGGFCTWLPGYGSPFIFSNFNGTAADLDVLTHEAGHAFQVWSSRTLGIPEYFWPTAEACEIHSMSMEFFTWPWMDLFFRPDTSKYLFAHLSGALLFLPYGTAVDEFQHLVYQHPEATPEERNRFWRELERRYLPHRNYEGNDYLEAGGFWKKQSHVFLEPFYYIDYTLAQICALQFWKRAESSPEGRREAWQDYLRICRAGGSRSFLGLVELAHLTSPFEDGCVEMVVEETERWLDAIDDSAF